MADDAPKKNGPTPLVTQLSSIGGASAIVLSLAYSEFTSIKATIENVRKDAATSVHVAEQHGQEFVLLNQRLERFTLQLADLRAQMDLGGRFTSEDGQRLREAIDRLEVRVDRLRDEAQRAESAAREHAKLPHAGP